MATILHLEVNNALIYAYTYWKYKVMILSGTFLLQILRKLATQAMSVASYFSTGSLPRDQYFHYGLALDYYTHFTSPIRRYADVLVSNFFISSVAPSSTCTRTVHQDIFYHRGRKFVGVKFSIST